MRSPVIVSFPKPARMLAPGVGGRKPYRSDRIVRLNEQSVEMLVTQGDPRLVREQTRPLKLPIDACCGVAPERSVRSNQRVDLGGRQLDPLIAQRRQCAGRIAQEIQTIFLVGDQATDDQLNGSQ